MLVLLTLVVMGAVGYAYFKEGVLTAFSMLVNVMLAGLLTFNFFEPLAGELQGMFQNTFLDGLEDAFAMMLIFAPVLGLLRLTTNNLASNEIELPALPRQVATVAIALVTGYLVAGFLCVMMQTLPWNERFLGFEATVQSNESGLRKVLPPDRVWLAMMHRAGGKGPLADEDNPSFDPRGSFELRYAKQRRTKEQP
jgi:hypothetical protein